MRHLSRDEPLSLFPYPDSWHPDDWIDERSFRKNASDALDSDGRAVDYLLLNNKRGRKDEDRVRAMLTLSLSLCFHSRHFGGVTLHHSLPRTRSIGAFRHPMPFEEQLAQRMRGTRRVLIEARTDRGRKGCMVDWIDRDRRFRMNAPIVSYRIPRDMERGSSSDPRREGGASEA